jgi:hypothetical protein
MNQMAGSMARCCSRSSSRAKLITRLSMLCGVQGVRGEPGGGHERAQTVWQLTSTEPSCIGGSITRVLVQRTSNWVSAHLADRHRVILQHVHHLLLYVWLLPARMRVVNRCMATSRCHAPTTSRRMPRRTCTRNRRANL